MRRTTVLRWLFCLIIAGLLAMTLGAGVLFLLKPRPGQPTLANWKQVSKGMSLSSVIQLLGAPGTDTIDKEWHGEFNLFQYPDSHRRMSWQAISLKGERDYNVSFVCHFDQHDRVYAIYSDPFDPGTAARERMKGDSWMDQLWRFLGY